MADAPYLIALALLEQNGKRALPLSGKSQSLPPSNADSAGQQARHDMPTDDGKALALELLLRIWQRTDDGPLKRAVGANSFLLVELPMERLPEDLPAIKAAWIQSGDFSSFLLDLKKIAERGWTLEFAKYQPVSFKAW